MKPTAVNYKSSSMRDTVTDTVRRIEHTCPTLALRSLDVLLQRSTNEPVLSPTLSGVSRAVSMMSSACGS